MAQQGVNDLVYCSGKQEVGSCQGWGPGKGELFSDSGVRLHRYLCRYRREERGSEEKRGQGEIER